MYFIVYFVLIIVNVYEQSIKARFMNLKNHETILNTGEDQANFIGVTDRNELNAIQAIRASLL